MNTATITAAHAVFHGDGHKKAPAAVVGYQFKHERLQEWFENITSSVSQKILIEFAMGQLQWCVGPHF